MSASVTASEAARAQDEKSCPPGMDIVIFSAITNQNSEAQIPRNGMPWRVKAPYGIGGIQ